MKLTSLVLCLLLLLYHTHFSVAKPKKTATPNRSSSNTNSGSRSNQGSSSSGGTTKKSGQANQGDTNQHRGTHKQHPGWVSPSGGHHGGHGRHHGAGHKGGYRHGNFGRTYAYPGGYSYQNPYMSPHYRGSFGDRGYSVRGGSPFSRAVQNMNMYPSEKSRGYGRNAFKAADRRVLAGAAVGYGIGRFPHPSFNFKNTEEQHYYNHYMYKKYGAKSTDANDYSRDYVYVPSPQTYESYMDSCMKRTDLLTADNQKQNKTSATTNSSAVTTSAPGADLNSSNTTENNITAAGNSSSSATPTPTPPPNQRSASPVSPTSQDVGSDENDDDTVSIMEIGYPALINQLKVRKCLGLYMNYNDKYLQRVAAGVQGLEMGLRGPLAVITSALVMLLNSNMLTLLN